MQEDVTSTKGRVESADSGAPFPGASKLMKNKKEGAECQVHECGAVSQ
jgi:hypothetical protein